MAKTKLYGGSRHGELVKYPPNSITIRTVKFPVVRTRAPHERHNTENEPPMWKSSYELEDYTARRAVVNGVERTYFAHSELDDTDALICFRFPDDWRERLDKNRDFLAERGIK